MAGNERADYIKRASFDRELDKVTRERDYLRMECDRLSDEMIQQRAHEHRLLKENRDLRVAKAEEATGIHGPLSTLTLFHGKPIGWWLDLRKLAAKAAKGLTRDTYADFRQELVEHLSGLEPVEAGKDYEVGDRVVFRGQVFEYRPDKNPGRWAWPPFKPVDVEL